MRVSFLGLLTAGFLASQAVAPLAQAQCVRPADRTSLDVAALKSSLMVTALTCSAQDRYNAFIQKFQPELAAQDKALGAYFSRSNAKTGQTRHDQYNTQLALTRSQDSSRQGGLFCSRSLPVFDEVLALRDNKELADYAASHQVEQPMNVSECGTAAPAPSHTSTPARSNSRGHHRG